MKLIERLKRLRPKAKVKRVPVYALLITLLDFQGLLLTSLIVHGSRFETIGKT